MILAAEYVPSMYATVWALVPPVVAIVLAPVSYTHLTLPTKA